MRTILIADDHPLFRDALRRAVMQVLPDAALREADSVQSLVELAGAHPHADLLLVDASIDWPHFVSIGWPVAWDRVPSAARIRGVKPFAMA